jgi:hypothetical protein
MGVGLMGLGMFFSAQSRKTSNSARAVDPNMPIWVWPLNFPSKRGSSALTTSAGPAFRVHKRERACEGPAATLLGSEVSGFRSATRAHWWTQPCANRQGPRAVRLVASTALVAGAVFPAPLEAAVPTPTVVSQSMIEAARRERIVAFYTAIEIPLAESLGKAFEAKYPGLEVRAKR